MVGNDATAQLAGVLLHLSFLPARVPSGLFQPATSTTVAPGIVKRFTALVAHLKTHQNYAGTIGEDLQIVGTAGEFAGTNGPGFAFLAADTVADSTDPNPFPPASAPSGNTKPATARATTALASGARWWVFRWRDRNRPDNNEETKTQRQTTMKTMLNTLKTTLLSLLGGLLLAAPQMAQAQFTYTTNNGALTVTGWTGSGTTADIPSMANGLPVVAIGTQAFFNQTGLTSVTIPNSVTNIGDWAFFYCTGLTAIQVDPLNANYSSLAGVLFNKAQSLLLQYPIGIAGSYIIGNSVTSIGSYAFSSCSGLTSVTIPNSVTSIGSYAFYNCYRLTSVTIPNSVTSIGNEAFAYCSQLRTAFFQGNAPTAGSSPFGSCTNVCYYLPGQSGWGSTYAGRPAYLWNPAPQTTGPNFGVSTNGFGFTITGTAGIPIAVEATTNLARAAWVRLQTCTLTNGSLYFSDPAWTNYPTRAYRISSP